jgi:hypothetical protein
VPDPTGTVSSAYWTASAGGVEIPPQGHAVFEGGGDPAPTISITAPAATPATVTGSTQSLVANATDAAAIAWSRISGPQNVEFSAPASSATTARFLAPGTYQLAVTANFGPAPFQYQAVATRALNVAFDPASLEDWRVLNWPGVNDPAVVGDTADPDADGIPNLLEFVTGNIPTSSTPLPWTLAVRLGLLDLTYPRAVAAATTATLTPQWSDTLTPTDWSTTGIEQTVISSANGIETIRASVPINAAAARFLRLRAARP